MKERKDRMPADAKPRLNETLQHLVQLYETTGQSEKAAEWKKRLEDLNPGAKSQRLDKPK